MGDIRPNFSKWELDCPCCGLFVINDEFLDHLQALRDFIGVPIFPTSGTRCETHNARIGGSPNSRHMSGQAVDMFADGIKGAALYEFSDKYLDLHFDGNGGLGFYIHKGHVHFDTRHTKWRDPHVE
jgi:uncharacterized protein YcbK (DUF882 family)